MIEEYPKKIDPERVKYQLDKLVTAFLDAAEEMIDKEKELLKAADTAPKPTQ